MDCISEKISPRRQIIIKYDTANLIMNAKLEHQRELKSEVTSRKTAVNVVDLSNISSCSNSNSGISRYYPPSMPQLVQLNHGTTILLASSKFTSIKYNMLTNKFIS